MGNGGGVVGQLETTVITIMDEAELDERRAVVSFLLRNQELSVEELADAIDHGWHRD